MHATKPKLKINQALSPSNLSLSWLLLVLAALRNFSFNRSLFLYQFGHQRVTVLHWRAALQKMRLEWRPDVLNTGAHMARRICTTPCNLPAQNALPI